MKIIQMGAEASFATSIATSTAVELFKCSTSINIIKLKFAHILIE
jgi:hypothetical protein